MYTKFNDKGRLGLDSQKCTCKQGWPCPLHGDDMYVDSTACCGCTRVEQDGWCEAAGDKVQVISVKTILPMAWPAETTAVVAMASGLVVAPLVAGVVTWRFCRGRFSGGEAVGVSVLSARLRVFLGSGVARPPDGVPAGGFPLLLRLEIRTGSGGFGAWRVLLVVREAGIVSG